MSSGAEVSAYDRMCWPLEQLESALASGAHRRELAAFLGESEHARLTDLARQAQSASPLPSSPTLYLLPGILGSQLGRARAAGEPADLLWIDPDDIVRGRLTELAGQDPSVRTLGAIVYSYLALRLRLRSAGFTVVVHDYDWRDDLIAQGTRLAARLEADASEQLVLIGHSMGGLLARAALQQLRLRTADARITRLISVGTPHGGALAAVQALRATYPVVCRLAAIDRLHDAQQLTTGVFHGFTSLYQLLPTDADGIDLFDPDSWPGDGLRPEAARLRAARGFAAQLAAADARFICIQGTGQRTVTGIARSDAEFSYHISSAGDGTVPVSSASLPGVRSYSLRCEHSALPRDARVAAALIDLALHGRTRRLRANARPRSGRVLQVTDGMLRAELVRNIDWHTLSIDERRRYMNQLNEPPAAYRVGAR